jgi:hypothetical protein
MKIAVNGAMVEATRMQVVKAEERGNEYFLADGTVVAIRTVLVSLYRVEGQSDQDGQPVYQCRTQLIVTADRGAS